MSGPYPLLDQLMLVKATIMNVALYPAAVRDVDYDGLDRFLYRSLIDMTRCPSGRTSATFLRAELGLMPSKFMGHVRALNFLWHIRRKAEFSAKQHKKQTTHFGKQQVRITANRRPPDT